MITLSKSGNSVTFTFDENSGYLQNGTIDVPINSLALITDESDMATFRKAASNDIFISARYEEFGMSKAELEAWYKENMVGSTGGGGGVDSGTVQTMIDESISGKAESVSAVSSAEYVSSSTTIDFKNVDGDVISSIDASDFVIDGMIDDVRIETISGVSYLVIDFNTASGKEDIQIPLTDIFDPSNYYTKQEVDASLSGKQDTIIAGRGIDITNDVVSLDLPISAGTGTNSLIMSGSGNTASGDYSVAYGKLNSASGECSTANGNRNTANNFAEFSIGQKNVSRTEDASAFGHSGNTLFSVGNGIINEEQGIDANHNAFEVRGNGEIYISDTNAAGSYYQKPMINLQNTLNGKQDTLSAGTNITISGNVISAEGGKPIEGGRGITVTTGETADTVSFNLPISADSNTYINAGAANTIGNNAQNILIGSGNTAYDGGRGTVLGGTAIGFGNEVGYKGFPKHYQFAFGFYNKIHGSNSYAIGVNNNIGSRGHSSKDHSYLIGYYNTCTFNGDSSGDYIFGNHCTVSKSDEFALGKYNASNTGSTDADRTFFSVGNGTADNARHNAFEIRQNGDIYLSLNGQDVKLQDQLGGKAIEAGRGISIETGATADTVSFNLPISAGTGSGSVIMGHPTKVKASGNYSFAGGENSSATTYWAFSYGAAVRAAGQSTVAFGYQCYANSSHSFICGYFNSTNNDSEFGCGKYNISNTGSTASAQTLFSVGNGTSTSARHNAFEIRQNGDIYLTKDGQDVKLQDQLGGGEVSSAITSGDTNAVAGGAVYDKFDEVEQVTAAGLNALNDKFDGMKLKKLTQSQYDALAPNYDASTLYVIVN